MQMLYVVIFKRVPHENTVFDENIHYMYFDDIQ